MPSFDIVSEVKMNEVLNAVDNANRELATRFDFRGVEASFELNKEEVKLEADADFQLKQMVEILRGALNAIPRGQAEAAIAKLTASEAAMWITHQALQIHGGNGFALEYPISRVLCDARILNIFEGAAEIQAQVIARRLLSE